MMKYNKDSEYYGSKSLSMMMYLVRHGFDVVKVGDNENNPVYKVFLFIDSKELRQCMSNFN